MGTPLSTALIVLAACGTAEAQRVHHETFEYPEEYQNWTINNLQLVYQDASCPQGEHYLGYPGSAAEGVTIGNGGSGELLGDLTRYIGGLSVQLFFRVFRLEDLNGVPMDPSSHQLLLRLLDEGDPEDAGDDTSVYVVGPVCPRQQEGWLQVTLEVPRVMGAEMPPGWRGTGDFDPTTGEPRLPLHRTYSSVLRSVDRVEFTTVRPGSAPELAVWEVGFDWVWIRDPFGCNPDYTQDGNQDQDDIAYLVQILAGGENPTGFRADFNLDGNADQDDIPALIGALFGAGCDS